MKREFLALKPYALALGAVVLTSISTATWAGERGHHGRHHYHGHHGGHGHHYKGHGHRHHSSHGHHHYSSSHGHNGAYLIGGMVLGAAISELSRPRETYTKETVYVTRTEYVQPRTREYRLEGDGRCYEVDNRGDRVVLLEVSRSACY